MDCARSMFDIQRAMRRARLWIIGLMGFGIVGVQWISPRGVKSTWKKAIEAELAKTEERSVSTL